MALSILVVDDSQPMRAVIVKTIRAAGFGDAQFFEAANGREAVEKLGENWVDIVVTDYNMPDMNGMDLLLLLKKDSVFSSIPVLMVTTEGSLERVDAFLRAGASGYIKKPFTPEKIREQLISILGAPHGNDAENCDEGLDF
ncbi:response regulator [Desulfobotulus sp. H1]|uniref:Response regulator n=1 Tax=Desulfobotulus pelophilus TaxID=2823377 RepID=A0ABT3NDV1_9BACT|nr:response regulator [Desulfobotulus pelophilus]MCW7755356.1 response regulator [Desulfobotulus pelophilus]